MCAGTPTVIRLQEMMMQATGQYLSAFAGSQMDGGNKARRNKRNLFIERNHENFIYQEATQPRRGMRPGTGIRVRRRSRTSPGADSRACR
jgi:hypothetical protein